MHVNRRGRSIATTYTLEEEVGNPLPRASSLVLPLPFRRRGHRFYLVQPGGKVDLLWSQPDPPILFDKRSV